MTALIDDLLFLTRAEADAIRFDIETVLLHDVVEEAMGEGRVIARSSGVGLRDDLPADPVVVRGDRQRLKQAMLIAIDNAVKYSDHGMTVDITLVTDEVDAVLTVRNRGDGIRTRGPALCLRSILPRPAERGQVDSRQRTRIVDRKMDRREACRYSLGHEQSRGCDGAEHPSAAR